MPMYLIKMLYKEEGIKSLILIPIIMAMEKERQKVINLFILLSLILKKITIPPKSVDIPANDEIRKAFKVLINFTYLNII